MTTNEGEEEKSDEELDQEFDSNSEKETNTNNDEIKRLKQQLKEKDEKIFKLEVSESELKRKVEDLKE
jgi:hypothetical protein